MTECSDKSMSFSRVGRREVVADFLGGRLTSDAGIVLLKEVDRRIGLLQAINDAIPDPRDPLTTVHDQRTMLTQRIFSIAMGYEDLNDQQTLRTDAALQVAAGVAPTEAEPMASPSTLCRLENRVMRKTLVELSKVLERSAAELMARAEAQYQETGEKARLFGETNYAAETWDKERRVIIKSERLEQGLNTRFVVTNLPGEPQELYDDVYALRGDMENRIKEQQLMLFADRTSCHDFQANQFRLLLSTFAYVLMDTLRREYLQGTELETAQCSTIRLKLFKIAARVRVTVRRVWFHLSSSYPYQALFQTLSSRLIPDTG